ncbi:MAG TPA: hypothetical protein VLX68_05550 [Chitinivibrionales bacterium]|nr:hypothetical protein [Chitinivibrionales bacterium]
MKNKKDDGPMANQIALRADTLKKWEPAAGLRTIILKSKANATVEKIGRMDEKQRRRLTAVAFGEDYNKLHERVKKEFTGETCILPPAAICNVRQGKRKKATCTCADIHFYCSKIYFLLE